VSKSALKNTGIFDDGSINGIDAHILERKMGVSVKC
jgi:hypothetical protein